MTAILYSRVSTDDQAANGHGLKAQMVKMDLHADAYGLVVAHRMSDDGVSGSVAPDERAALSEALALLSGGQADTLVVASLSRLSRRTRDVLEIADRADREGWRLIILDLALDTGTPTGRMTLTVLAAIAELERAQTIERTREGLAQAKREGRRLGRPASDNTRAAGRRGQQLRAEGRSWSAVAAALQAEGFVTAQGKGTWSKTQAVRAVKTVELDDQAEAAASDHAGDTDND